MVATAQEEGGVCFKVVKNGEKQQLQDGIHDKIPPGQTSFVSVKKSWKYAESIMAHKAFSESKMRILVSKGYNRAQFGTRVNIFVKLSWEIRECKVTLIKKQAEFYVSIY